MSAVVFGCLAGALALWEHPEMPGQKCSCHFEEMFRTFKIYRRLRIYRMFTSVDVKTVQQEAARLGQTNGKRNARMVRCSSFGLQENARLCRASAAGAAPGRTFDALRVRGCGDDELVGEVFPVIA